MRNKKALKSEIMAYKFVVLHGFLVTSSRMHQSAIIVTSMASQLD